MSIIIDVKKHHWQQLFLSKGIALGASIGHDTHIPQQLSGLLSEEIMKFANHLGYSDVTPYEVIRIVSDKTIEIREMKTERDDSVKLEFHVGGFSAHCSNQNEQKWIITSDETAPVKRIRLGKRGWKDAHGGRYNLADKPRKYYDYNF